MLGLLSDIFFVSSVSCWAKKYLCVYVYICGEVFGIYSLADYIYGRGRDRDRDTDRERERRNWGTEKLNTLSKYIQAVFHIDVICICIVNHVSKIFPQIMSVLNMQTLYTAIIP